MVISQRVVTGPFVQKIYTDVLSTTPSVQVFCTTRFVHKYVHNLASKKPVQAVMYMRILELFLYTRVIGNVQKLEQNDSVFLEKHYNISILLCVSYYSSI